MGKDNEGASIVPRGTKKAGAPTKFNELVKNKILELTAQGRSFEETAEIIGISTSTLYLWVNEKQEFSIAFREARAIADDLVEAALFQRAIGYKHKAQKWFQHEGHSWAEEYQEQYPPDTKAAQFWLTNRRPKDWRDKQHIEHSGEIENKSDLQEILKNPETAELAIKLSKALSAKKNEPKPE